MSVHYKFKAALDFSTVTFDGISISVGDLKKEIIEQKRLAKNADFDLQIQNAQTKEVYEDEGSLIPKNTSVIVARVPVVEKKKGGGPASGPPGPGFGRERFANQQRNHLASLPPTASTKSVDLTAMEGSEEDKIKAMMSQSTADYDPSRYMKIRGQGQYGKVPESYTCYKCNQTGHWIKNCPLNSQVFKKHDDKHEVVKKSTGIPRTFMVLVEGPQVPGALITPEGQYAVPSIDHETYMAGKNKSTDKAPEPQPKPKIPEELICPICQDLLTDALMVPCCATSYCDECIRTALLDSEDQECPGCHEKETSPTFLIPNRFLRTTVNAFKNETGYSKPSKIHEKLESPHKQAQVAAAEERKASTELDELPEDLFPHSPKKIDDVEPAEEGKGEDDLYDFDDAIPSPFANQGKGSPQQFHPHPNPNFQPYPNQMGYGHGPPPQMRGGDYNRPPPNYQSGPHYGNQPPQGHDLRPTRPGSREPPPPGFGDVPPPGEDRGPGQGQMRDGPPGHVMPGPQMMPMPGQFYPMQGGPLGFPLQGPPGMGPPIMGGPPGPYPPGPYPPPGYGRHPGSYPMDRRDLRDDYRDRDRERRDRDRDRDRDRRPYRDYRDSRDDRGRSRLHPNDENRPTGPIDDPLKEFERIMREKDRRKLAQKRSHSRSPPPLLSSPSRRPSRSPSPRGDFRKRSPSYKRSPSHRNYPLERRYSYSRSRSRTPPLRPRRSQRSRSPLSPRDRIRDRSISPRRRRSPPPRRAPPFSPSSPQRFPKKEKDEYDRHSTRYDDRDRERDREKHSRAQPPRHPSTKDLDDGFRERDGDRGRYDHDKSRSQGHHPASPGREHDYDNRGPRRGSGFEGSNLPAPPGTEPPPSLLDLKIPPPGDFSRNPDNSAQKADAPEAKATDAAVAEAGAKKERKRTKSSEERKLKKEKKKHHKEKKKEKKEKSKSRKERKSKDSDGQPENGIPLELPPIVETPTSVVSETIKLTAPCDSTVESPDHNKAVKEETGIAEGNLNIEETAGTEPQSLEDPKPLIPIPASRWDNEEEPGAMDANVKVEKTENKLPPEILRRAENVIFDKGAVTVQSISVSVTEGDPGHSSKKLTLTDIGTLPQETDKSKGKESADKGESSQSSTAFKSSAKTRLGDRLEDEASFNRSRESDRDRERSGNPRRRSRSRSPLPAKRPRSRSPRRDRDRERDRLPPRGRSRSKSRDRQRYPRRSRSRSRERYAREREYREDRERLERARAEDLRASGSRRSRSRDREERQRIPPPTRSPQPLFPPSSRFGRPRSPPPMIPTRVEKRRRDSAKSDRSRSSDKSRGVSGVAAAFSNPFPELKKGKKRINIKLSSSSKMEKESSSSSDEEETEAHKSTNLLSPVAAILPLPLVAGDEPKISGDGDEPTKKKARKEKKKQKSDSSSSSSSSSSDEKHKKKHKKKSKKKKSKKSKKSK